MASFSPELAAVRSKVIEFATKIRTDYKPKPAGLIGVAYDIPYYTGAILDGEYQLGVVMDVGYLVNSTTKLHPVPQVVLNEWSPVGRRWVDTGASFMYNPVTNETQTLPFTSEITRSGNIILGDQVSITLGTNNVRIYCQSDRSAWKAVVTLKYLKPIPVT